MDVSKAYGSGCHNPSCQRMVFMAAGRPRPAGRARRRPPFSLQLKLQVLSS
jgi:hypothetical protein